MIGSTSGRWTCFIEPLRTRRMVLRLFRRDYATDYTAVFVNGNVVPVKTYEVRQFELLECSEGDFAVPDNPAIKSGIEGGLGEDRTEVISFLQAVVDEAAKWGVFASGQKDMTREISALRDHLEDMRQLQIGEKYKPLTRGR